MRAKNVIIVSSGQANQAPIDGVDRLIRAIIDLKKNPILVLGPDGDDVLRQCSEIENCELVFDPNFAGGFFSGVKAGLHATTGASFVVPLVGKHAPDQLKIALTEVENAVPGDGSTVQCDVIVTQEAVGAPEKELFLVTSRGIGALKKIAAAADWKNSEQISVLTVPLLSEADRLSLGLS